MRASLLESMIKNNSVTYATMVGGLFLIALGVLGFPFQGLLGMRLGVYVNLAHLASGSLALYFGLNAKSLASLRNFCIGLGVAYGLAGVIGFAFGEPGRSLSIFSGNFTLPNLDHLFHLILGVGFVWAGIIQPLAPAPSQIRPGRERSSS